MEDMPCYYGNRVITWKYLIVLHAKWEKFVSRSVGSYFVVLRKVGGFLRWNFWFYNCVTVRSCRKQAILLEICICSQYFQSFCRYGRATTAADAAPCQGCGPQLYGPAHEVIGLNTKHNIFLCYLGTLLVRNQKNHGLWSSKI